MAYGMQIFGSAGQLLLDSTVNLQTLVAVKGTVSLVRPDPAVSFSTSGPIYVTGLENTQNWQVFLKEQSNRLTINKYDGYFDISTAFGSPTLTYYVCRSQ